MREGWPCWSFSNHDVERAASRWHPRGRAAGHDPDFVRLLMALLLSLRGSVCLYQGEELGLTEAELAFADLRDPFGIAFWPEFRGRDGSRTPMPWRAAAPQRRLLHRRPLAADPRAAPGAGGGCLGGAAATGAASSPGAPGNPRCSRDSLLPLDLPEPLVGFVREAEGQRMLCLFNLAETPVRADLSRWGRPTTEPVLPRFGVLLADQPVLVA